MSDRRRHPRPRLSEYLSDPDAPRADPTVLRRISDPVARDLYRRKVERGVDADTFRSHEEVASARADTPPKDENEGRSTRGARPPGG